MGGGEGNVAGLDDGLKRGALVFQVALGDLDEIGNEVVATLQLHVDLGEGVFEAVAEGDEGIVDANGPEGEGGDEGEENAEDDESAQREKIRFGRTG